MITSCIEKIVEEFVFRTFDVDLQDVDEAVRMIQFGHDHRQGLGSVVAIADLHRMECTEIRTIEFSHVKGVNVAMRKILFGLIFETEFSIGAETVDQTRACLLQSINITDPFATITVQAQPLFKATGERRFVVILEEHARRVEKTIPLMLKNE